MCIFFLLRISQLLTESFNQFELIYENKLHKMNGYLTVTTKCFLLRLVLGGSTKISLFHRIPSSSTLTSLPDTALNLDFCRGLCSSSTRWLLSQLQFVLQSSGGGQRRSGYYFSVFQTCSTLHWPGRQLSEVCGNCLGGSPFCPISTSIILVWGLVVIASGKWPSVLGGREPELLQLC